MNSSIGIIGGADGPTAVFVAGSCLNWINTYGICFVIAILIPNILYALRHKGQENKCKNRLMNLMEQLGRYGCMLTMCSGLGFHPFWFSSVSALTAYVYGNPLLILAYWLCWIPYWRKPGKGLALALALLPTAVFLLSGITMQYHLLTVLAVVFGIGHGYVTMHNH